MEDNQTPDLFARVDALLEQAAAPMPEPAQRRALREARHLTLEQVATALGISADLLEAWESGFLEPSGPQRAAYARLLDGLRSLHRGSNDQDTHNHTPAPRPAPVSRRPQAPGPRGAASPQAAYTKPSPAPAGEIFPSGPLAVLSYTDTLTAHLADGATRECPATTIVEVLHWALEAGIGQPRLTKYDHPADPLIVLTTTATEHLGLPLELEDRAGLRLRDDHPWHTALTEDGWKFTRRGFSPWARIYQPYQAAGRRRCVQLAILPWGALTTGGWEPPPGATAADLARWLGTYAKRVLTPCGSTAVCGQELMTALRPPTKPVRDPSGTWRRGHHRSGLWNAMPPAPPEAHDAHPLAQGRHPSDALDEEAWDWHRPPTPEETAYSHVVGIDINVAFLAAASSLSTGLNTPPEHVIRPDFDKKTPGAWYCDLSHIDTDPRLPSPFTPTGAPPTGPAWYATPTLAYAQELGATIQPTEAYLRTDHGIYLTPWYNRLRDAYLATMHDLGITPEMTQVQYLQAMRALPQKDPYLLTLLAAIKATAKGGIGKLRAGPPPDPHRGLFDPWPALNTPTWRPDIRAAVISKARVNMHRKMRKTAEATGRYPLAVLSDCALYPAHAPHALDVLPAGTDGKGTPGAFRLGVNPGLTKEEGAQSMDWFRQIHDDGANPAHGIKE